MKGREGGEACFVWRLRREDALAYPTSPRRRAMAAPRPDAPPVRRTVLPLRGVRSGGVLRSSLVRAGEMGWR